MGLVSFWTLSCKWNCLFQVRAVMCKRAFLKLLSLHRAGGLCLYRIEEWWTFELCYKEHVRQFHKEQNQVVSEYSLGTFKEEEVNQDEIKVNLARLACRTKRQCTGCCVATPNSCPSSSDKGTAACSLWSC